MNFIDAKTVGGIATVTLNRGKVNALNEPLIEELRVSFENLENDDTVKSVILTGEGKFFSFGFDIPEFYDYSREDFRSYLEKFTGLYTYLFLFPKPIIAALNGHTIAGGCMLATACDYRIMVTGKAKISLNEVTFGASVFAGSVDILKFCVGQRNAETILSRGTMYNAEEALKLGLIDQVSTVENLVSDTSKIAEEFALKDPAAYSSIKRLLRKPIADEMIKREAESISEFLDIWYSENMRKHLKEIKIN